MTEAERNRLQEVREDKQPWYRWGPYLSERQWGTVREDYSPNGEAWDFLTHDQARSHTYRWGEDGLMGISDDQQQLCFALALWNGADSILKERLRPDEFRGEPRRRCEGILLLSRQHPDAFVHESVVQVSPKRLPLYGSCRHQSPSWSL